MGPPIRPPMVERAEQAVVSVPWVGVRPPVQPARMANQVKAAAVVVVATTARCKVVVVVVVPEVAVVPVVGRGREVAEASPSLRWAAT